MVQQAEIDYYSSVNNQPAPFEQKNKEEVNQLDKDQAKMLAEILTLLAGTSMSKELQDLTNKYNIDTEDKKGGLVGAIDSIKESIKNIKEKFNSAMEWIKKYKLFIGLGVLILGGAILIMMYRQYIPIINTL